MPPKLAAALLKISEGEEVFGDVDLERATEITQLIEARAYCDEALEPSVAKLSATLL